jgi:1,4-dihydroxy-2-naphthoate octaprenyltransferase
VAAFAVAAAAGIALVALCGQWWLAAVGATCIAAAWFYTGGRRPYGYRGLGEVFVFIYFGLVAVLGTTYVQAGRISLAALCAATGVGAFTCAILVVNNLRDLPKDAAAGKRTLAVRLGDRRTRRLYMALLGVAWLALVPVVLARPWAALTFLVLPGTFRLCRRVPGGAVGTALIAALRATGALELVYGLLLGCSLAVGPGSRIARNAGRPPLTSRMTTGFTGLRLASKVTRPVTSCRSVLARASRMARPSVLPARLIPSSRMAAASYPIAAWPSGREPNLAE